MPFGLYTQIDTYYDLCMYVPHGLQLVVDLSQLQNNHPIRLSKTSFPYGECSVHLRVFILIERVVSFLGSPSLTFPLTNACRLITNEDKFVIMVPAVLLDIHAWLQLSRCACRARATAADQPEALFLQHIKRLLDKAVLKEEA